MRLTTASGAAELDLTKDGGLALLPKTGGTMAGAIVLSGDGTSALHPATKQQLDAEATARAAAAVVAAAAQATANAAMPNTATALALILVARAATDALQPYFFGDYPRSPVAPCWTPSSAPTRPPSPPAPPPWS